MNSKSRKKGRIVGFTCSAFDLCHAGHMIMLADCKRQCDYLVVGLQDDPSVDNHKNIKYRGKLKNKPIMTLEERKIILESIKYVDEIFIYKDEDDLYEKLKNLDYDVRILGSDWEGKKYTGWDLPHRAYFHQRNHPYSSTALREKIYRVESEKLESEPKPQVSQTKIKPAFLRRRLA